jgi:hypothetical protein
LPATGSNKIKTQLRIQYCQVTSLMPNIKFDFKYEKPDLREKSISKTNHWCVNEGVKKV